VLERGDEFGKWIKTARVRGVAHTLYKLYRQGDSVERRY
jgi:hypothetical protein